MWFTTEDSGQVLDNQASKAASSRKPSWRFLVELISPHCSVVSALCDPMNCSMPGFPVLHYLLEFAQIHVHWDSDAIPTISSSVTLVSFCLQSFPASGYFPISQLFASGGQSSGASALASVLLMNTQGWFPLGLTGLSPWSPRDSQESSPAPQVKSMTSLVFSFLYSPTLTSIHDYWKNHSFD